MKKFKIVIVCLMLLSFIITGISFAFLNDTIPNHFGIDGQPDQYGSKYFILIFPLIMTLIGIAMLLVSKYGKVSENYQKYMLLTGVIIEVIFNILLVMFIVFALSYVEDATAFDISKIMLPLLGLMFIIMGNFMPKIEKNRTLGVKTGWSMYNETTWQKTHRFAGFAGIIVGILCIILSLFFKEMINFIILMSLVFIFVISTTIASYIYYKEEKERETES